MQPSFAYTDLLVKNLLYISEVNIQLKEYYDRIDKNSPRFVELENSINGEILFHFANCIHVPVKYKDAKVFASGMNRTPENAKDRILLNIRNMSDYIKASYASERISLPLLLHLNKLFLDEVKDVWDIGKMISPSEHIDTTFDFFEKTTLIYQQQVPGYIRDIEDYYVKNPSPEIVKNALVFFELTHAAIFSFGNDPVGLGVLSFLFHKIEFHPMINYYRCIGAIIGKHEENESLSKEDVFLELFFNELSKEVRELRNKLSPFIEDMKADDSKYVDLNARQVRGLAYIKEKGRISREIYSKLNNISDITSYRDLNNLLQKGYVRVEGIGKGTKYVL